MAAALGKCSECGAVVEAEARFCPSCGVSFTGEAPTGSVAAFSPSPYVYDVVKASSHTELAKVLNLAAQDGWEPIEAYAWGNVYNAMHGVILRRLAAPP